MRRGFRLFRSMGYVVRLGVVLLCASPVLAQTVGGVAIDPAGALRRAGEISPAELRRLHDDDQRCAGNVSRPSDRRRVSLRRLESAVESCLTSGQPLPSEIRFLAGLVRIDGVTIDRDSRDVILAGPAEAWEPDSFGDVVGVKSRRPVLELDDLIIALRYAFPTNETDDFIGCSIDPTPEGMGAFDKLMRTQKTSDASRVEPLAHAMEQALGPQKISVFGVPSNSRFALKLVSADYRLKRLALGHDPSPIKSLTSFIDLAARNPVSGRVPQHRWWFTPGKNAVRASADRMFWKFEPDAVAVATARGESPREAKSVPGNSPGKSAPASKDAQLFADQATRAFPELARGIPVFAGLSNLITLSLTAEIVHQAATVTSDATSWRPSFLLDEVRCPCVTGTVPQTTPAIVNVRRGRGGAWVFAASGGVEFRPDSL
ncbi:MAG: DUF1598 domain-containing protein, partial [Planctomycetota bacterium]|nr:DUF1598 domain-containing protein [Planctomycetota bacterium]